jgi:hypothetical protein
MHLDEVNPSFARPQRFISLGALMLLLNAGISWVLATLAAPEIPFSRNPLAIISSLLALLSVVLGLIPMVFKWDWRVQYFGICSLYLASASLPGVTPWLCIVLYSRIPLYARIVLFLVFVLSIYWWCHRFVVYYRKVMSNAAYREKVYCEHESAVHYLQKNDAWLINKKYKFRQAPHMGVFLLAIIVAISIAPIMGKISLFSGLPFPYLFTAIGFFPFVLLLLGISVRGYLIYYYYPREIRKKTGKEIYIDMATRTLR